MHKSQGSAAEAVVAIADKSHTYQLNANLLYTALTRAKEDLVTLCQPKVINEAMKKVENLRRNTFLGELLKGDIA
jgi:ATP-dependent exoDNAse (exonuclease V) alpha subunit